ncbi:hypothetical protein LTR85_004461 [Meristemomyces frigidus]|nr:hypothetical protein LTR85_004461 [Meristemomyces frigidus]
MSDTGHYNCRDYHISPHFAPPTIVSTFTNGRYQLPRHESFDELMHRSRSPASFKPKFPLLRLPLELRQEILSYLLPKTKELLDTNPLAHHARNFSAVQKRGAKGMRLPAAAPTSNAAGGSSATSNIVWQRGNINVLCVCRQLHDECAELLYGSNTFLLFITFEGITFRFRWLIPNGLAPSSSKPFLELLPERYMRLVKRVVVQIDHVDSYTGMIKFNVGGKGLTHGLRRQVQRLVNALKPIPPQSGAGEDADHSSIERRLTKICIRVSNGNAVLDAVKSDIVRQREGGIRVAEDLEIMLEPLRQLYGVREVSISGAVTDRFARELEACMRSTERPEADERHVRVDVEDAGLGAPVKGVCVYGNDI